MKTANPPASVPSPSVHPPGRAKAPLAAQSKNPDVIVNRTDHTALFKMKNKTVSEWMREHYRSSAGSVTGNTEFRVHPTRCKRILEELKAAGFKAAVS